MATYIKNDSLENLNRTLQFLSQNANAIRNANLDERIARNRMGLNDREQWEVQNPFAKENMKMKELTPLQKMMTTASQDQGGILAELKVTNPTMYKFMIEQEASKKAMNPDDVLMNMNKMSGMPTIGTNAEDYGVSNKNLQDQKKEFKGLIDLYQQGLEQNNAANAPIMRDNQQAMNYNRQAEEFNKNNVKAFGGNEGEQQQELLRQTHRAIKAGGGVEAYNQYLATQKAIDDHYQHNTRPLPPAAFGMGAGTGKGSGKLIPHHYGRPGERSNVIEIPEWALGNQMKTEAYIKKNFPRFYDPESQIIGRVGSEGGDSTEDIILRNAVVGKNKSLAANAMKMYDQKTGWDVGEGDEKIFNQDHAVQELAKQGFEPIGKSAEGVTIFQKGNQKFYYNGGLMRYDDKNSQPAANTTKPEAPKKDYKKMGLW